MRRSDASSQWGRCPLRCPGAHRVPSWWHRATGPRRRPGRDPRRRRRVDAAAAVQVIVTTTDLNVSGRSPWTTRAARCRPAAVPRPARPRSGSFCLGHLRPVRLARRRPARAVPEIHGRPGARRTACRARRWTGSSTRRAAVGRGQARDRRTMSWSGPTPAPRSAPTSSPGSQDILNKKLYGQPMDDQEKAAYAELAGDLQGQARPGAAKWALEEYDKWNAQPVRLRRRRRRPPAAVCRPSPNDAASSTLCTAGRLPLHRSGQFTNGTPPADPSTPGRPTATRRRRCSTSSDGRYQ